MRAAFVYAPTIEAVANNVGSLAGGQTLTLTAGGAGFNPALPEANVVTVNGAPCTVTAVPDKNTLDCTAPSMYGHVLAEYWNLIEGRYDFLEWGVSDARPDVRRLEKDAKKPFGYDAPAPGINYDWFGARLTFYLQVCETRRQAAASVCLAWLSVMGEMAGLLAQGASVDCSRCMHVAVASASQPPLAGPGWHAALEG